jgi:hypothetical protein
MPSVRAGNRPATREAKLADAAQLERIEKELAALRERQDALFAALGFGPRARKGDRGTVGELNDAVLKIQDYLLRTSERLDNILGTLKNHRELLEKLSRRVYHSGTRERIRMELDIMKTTASILALNGVELDEAVLTEIDKLKASTGKEDMDILSLRKSKEKLDTRFDGEVGKFDLTSIYKTRNRPLAGYR